MRAIGFLFLAYIAYDWADNFIEETSVLSLLMSAVLIFIAVYALMAGIILLLGGEI